MKTFITIACVILSFSSTAQTPNLIVEGITPDLYLTHTVAPKESYYSLARLYNIAPAALATANKSNLQAGLKIGQVLRVPLNEQNFDQQGKKQPGEAMVPLYHMVEKSETMFRIGNNYNKVAPLLIKEWNGLSGDNIAVGTPLIVGYLKVKNEELDKLHVSAATGAFTTFVSEPKSRPGQKSGEPAPVESAALRTVLKEPKPEKFLIEPVQEVTPVVTAPVKPAEKMEAAVVKPTAAEKPEVDLLAPTTTAISDEGFFASTYMAEAEEKKIASNSGEAATFKSTSGWQNKKYYALINNVLPGTIIKVTSADKSIYAKVLGALPETKENTNLLVRLSNAAASYLGKIEPTFPVQVKYQTP